MKTLMLKILQAIKPAQKYALFFILWAALLPGQHLWAGPSPKEKADMQTASQTLPKTSHIPPIDLSPPSRVETFTFGLG